MANITQCFSLNYKDFLLDEISLDGLQGIGIELLWKRMEKRAGTPLTPKIKEKFWKFITSTDSISIFHVAEPPPIIDIIDRFWIVDEVTGYILDPQIYLDGPYEWCPIENEYGSCSNYNSRILISKNDIQSMPYEEVKSKYGDRLVLVASIEERWHALAPHLPITFLSQLTPVHYGLLELIGRGRENGQMTVGTTNISKIVKEPKLLFYNRNVLHKLGLIKVHYTTQITLGKTMKSILLRLKRFHQPILVSLPKVGLIANIVDYLLEQPDHSEANEVMIKKGYMTSKSCKRFQKTMYIFTFEERDVQVEKPSSSKSEDEFVKKKFISLAENYDDSSSDGEDERTPVECQYKVGVGIMRQAYERFLDAGLKGLTQTEIAQILGVEFYTSRSICRIFKAKNLVREFLVDKGRQRTARYIAVAATKEIDKEYDKEKNILLEHVQKAKESIKKNDSDSESEVPVKKLKLDKDNKNIEEDTTENPDNSITELKALEGCESVKESLLNARKNLTLRQLKYANGILKVIKELKYVIGFQTLSVLVSKEIQEPPMDTKALKLFVHKLMTDGQLKVLKISRPKRVYFLICAINIKPTDDVIKKKFKELCSKSQPKIKNIKPVETLPVKKPKWQFIYQRYVKIQKLHEFITKFVYFNEYKFESNLAPGFTTMLTIIPEMTVEFALSNLNNLETSDVAKLELDEASKALKIRDAPEKLRNDLLQSKSLQNSIKVIIKILAALGLIQLIHQPSTSRKNAANTYVFYVNRRAKILNTSGKWPRPVDKSVKEKSFYFETFEDVKKYWLDVTTISSNTIIHVAKRESLKLAHPLRNETSVELYDTGERLGDGLGPCGFDSSIFMDIPRLWRKFVFKTPKLPQTGPTKRKGKKALAKTRSRPIKVHKSQLTKVSSSSKVERRRKPADNFAPTWSSFDDKIIMLCKAAITVLSPTSQPGSLRLRNTVAKDLLTINDPKKTADYCHKRALLLESNSVMAYEKDCIINEMRRRRHLVKKYDGLLKALRLRHVGSINKCISEARLPLLELIWLASQIERAKPYIQRIPCIALNFDDFNKKYSITPTSSSRPYNVYKTPPNCEPEFATLKEGIILSVMLAEKNQVSKETARKIYSVFEVYPESTLRTAVEQLRQGGAITAREKIMNNKINKVNFDDIVESSFKISAAYRRRWITRFESEFLVNLADLLNSELPEEGLKGSSELNCILCEMSACNVSEIKLDTIPIITGSAGSIMQEEQMNVIDMETKFKLKSGTVGWKSKGNAEIFSEYFQTIDYKSILDSVTKENVVTFSDNDIVYDMQDPIILYLEEKGEKGSTFHELQQHLSMDRKMLCVRLKDLEAKKMVKRVGYYENLLTLTKYAIPMLLQIEPNFHIIPTPWLTLEGQMQIEIFMKWTSVIVNKVFESPGCSVEFLSNSFECISTRSVQDICTFLQECECVTLQCVEKIPVDLFSQTDDDVAAELSDYNQYDLPDNILVFPNKNLLTRYACLWKKVRAFFETDTQPVL